MFRSDDPRTLLNCPCFCRFPALEALPVAPVLPLALLLPRCRFPVSLLRLPPRPLPRSRPAGITAIPLTRMPRRKALFASLQKTVPRPRHCLLKGCEQRFSPRHARQRYCSDPCRAGARKWSRWKAQQRYRETAAGQQKRQGQNRRYRERLKSRKAAEARAVKQGARVITAEHFFRSWL